jgi:hypothetical protein
VLEGESALARELFDLTGSRSLCKSRPAVEGYVEQLQQRPPEQCHRLHRAEGRAGGASAADPRGTRPQVGNRETTTPESPPASRVKNEAASTAMSDSQGKPFLTHSMSDIRFFISL